MNQKICKMSGKVSKVFENIIRNFSEREFEEIR